MKIRIIAVLISSIILTQNPKAWTQDQNTTEPAPSKPSEAVEKPTEKPTEKLPEKQTSKNTKPSNRQQQIIVEKTQDKVDKIIERTTKAEPTKPVTKERSAADPLSTEEILKSLDYPELQVAPRASERLSMEASLEKGLGSYITYWPFMLSGLATFTSGYMSYRTYSANFQDRLDHASTTDPVSSATLKALDNKSLLAMATGFGWMAVSAFMGSKDFYIDGIKQIKNYKVIDKRTEIMRERLAEETLETPAFIMKHFTWISVSTNILANALILSTSEFDDSRKTIAAGALIASSLPLLFPNRYVTNYEKHLEYKRKIYTPLISLNYNVNQKNYKLEPLLALNWNY